MEFPNNPIYSQFEDFISTIIDRFKNGSLIIWGKVGEVQPPHLVMPITAEPTKPRMCHDERFFFLTCGLRIALFRWITYLIPLGTLVLVIFRLSVTTRVATTTFVYLHLVEPFLGFRGKVVISLIIPSPSDGRQVPTFITPVGLLATSYIRTLGVPCSQYIDDRHAGQLMVRGKPTSPIWSDFELTQAAAFILVSVLTSLGYTLALSKSSLVPSQRAVSWVTSRILF